MSTTYTGRQAEALVARTLQGRGHSIVAMNWRTRRCEIDIISTHKQIVFFTEVKYRSTTTQGSGFAYITPSKLKQMHFAAEIWLAERDWKGESVLLAAEVSPDNEVNIVEI